MTALLEFRRVEKRFTASSCVLSNINLEIHSGEFVVLVGHSGCGKSTLLSLLAGLEMASSGQVYYQGTPVTRPGPERMVVFQDHCLLPWLNVRENIALAVDRVCIDANPTARAAIIDRIIEVVELSDAATKRPAQLSGGMRQRVGLARALAIRPKVLLLDEPFSALDAANRYQLQDALMQLCAELGITVVMITHDIDEALLLSDRIIKLTPGPASTIHSIIKNTLPKPRNTLEIANHPDYYQMRKDLLQFLKERQRIS